MSVSSIVHAAQPIDIFEAKLLEDIDTSFVENASLTWTPPHSTMTHGQQGKRQWSRWPQKRSTKCWFGDPIGEVYCNCFSRWSREDLPSVSSHLEVRRAPVKESFGGIRWLLLSKRMGCVRCVIISETPQNITVFVLVGKPRMLSIVSADGLLIVWFRHKYSLYCSELVEVEVLSQWEMNKQLVRTWIVQN